MLPCFSQVRNALEQGWGIGDVEKNVIMCVNVISFYKFYPNWMKNAENISNISFMPLCKYGLHDADLHETYACLISVCKELLPILNFMKIKKTIKSLSPTQQLALSLLFKN